MSDEEYERWAEERGVEQLPVKEIGSGMHRMYLKVLSELDRAVKREMDRAQLGQEPSEAFARAASTALAERSLLLRGVVR